MPGVSLDPPQRSKPLETLQAGNDKKICAVGEGGLARSVRNGIQCLVTIYQWLLFSIRRRMSRYWRFGCGHYQTEDLVNSVSSCYRKQLRASTSKLW